MKSLLEFLLCLAIVAFTVGQASAAPVFSLSSPTDYRNDSWSFGQIFTVGSQNITVTALGAYDAGGNGFVSVGGIPVGIFRESDDALLASVNVGSGDPLAGNFRYASISPLLLLSGVSYRVVAVNLDDLYNVGSGFTVDPAITSIGYGYCNTTSLTSCDGFTGSDIVWMANFDATGGGGQVPEPATFVLSAAGLGALALIRRLRRHQA
jgi:hypothetical protein